MTRTAERPQAFAYAPVTPPGRLPPLWAMPLILIGLIAGGALLMWGVTLVVGTWADLTGRHVDLIAAQSWPAQLLVSVLFLGSLGGLTLFWVRRFEHRPLSTAGLAWPRAADLAPWLAGAVFAAGVGLWLAGGAPSTPVTGPGGLGAVFAAIALLIVTAAIVLAFGAVEELVLRGWALSVLSPKLGVGWALGITSVLFGMAHVPPSDWAEPARLIGFAGFTAMGVAFGAVALARRSLWSSIALHGGYNFAFAALAAVQAGFNPAEMVQGAMGGGSGFGDLTTALTLAVAQLVMAVAAVLWWRFRPTPPASPESVF